MVRNFFGRQGKAKKQQQKPAPDIRASELTGRQQSLNEISVYASMGAGAGGGGMQHPQQQQYMRQQGGPPHPQQQQQHLQYPGGPPKSPPRGGGPPQHSMGGRPSPSGGRPHPSPQQQQQHGSMGASGNRVTTSTVRVPPPQQQSPQRSPHQQHPRASPQQQQRPLPSPPLANGSNHTNTSHTSASEQRTNEPVEDKTTALTRDLVKKFIADIWNRGEIDLIPSVCSPSLRFNGNTGFDRVGHDGLARMVGTIRQALDDYHCEIHSMVVEHNKAFCRLRFTGKHTGNLLGFKPTHKVVAWMGATEFTCQNGKILKVWELGDVKSLEEQIGGGQHVEDDEDKK